MPTSLNLSTARTGSADLPFGASAGSGIISLTADITLPAVGVDARISQPTVVMAEIALPAVTVDARAAYMVNVWRGPQRSAAAPWEKPIAAVAEVESHLAGVGKMVIEARDRWQDAPALDIDFISIWVGLIHRPAETRMPWGVLSSMTHDAAPGWVCPRKRREARRLPWEPPMAAMVERRAGYFDPPRRQSTRRLPWTDAYPMRRSVHAGFDAHPMRRRDSVRMPWADGLPVISLWPRPDHWTPPVIVPDCSHPDRNLLDFTAPWSASPDIAFTCYCAPRPPAREPVVIPILRTYIVIHDIEVLRLPDGHPIHASRISLSMDADSWAWGFSATLLGREALDAVMPSALGEPVTLEVSINGHTWHLLVEDWAEDRVFGKRGVTVKGRGLSAMLASPYQLPTSGATTSTMTAQQLMTAHLPIGEGWSLSWADDTPDWLVPAGAWSWQGKAAINAIADAATGAGLVIVPAKSAKSLTIQPRYPVLPWAFDSATPGLILPGAAILNLQRGQAIPTQASAVYVAGGDVGGLAARVLRTGTAGDRIAPTQTSPLMTHVDAARLLGSRLLAAQAQQPEVRSITTVMGGAFALGEIGQLLRAEVDGAAHLGIINSVSIDAARSADKVTVRQTLTIGEDTPNSWARFKRLLPDDPLLIGTVETDHGDGTATVTLLGGGHQRVRGSGTLGQPVYVRGGMIEGAAPSMAQVEIEV